MSKIEESFLKSVSLCSSAGDKLGIYSLLRSLTQGKATILMYHGVTKEPNSVANFDGKHVEAEKFEKQVQYLMKHYSIISIDDFILWRYGKKKTVKKPALLTFDDGYKNCYTILFPIIKKYNTPITIFLPTAAIEKKEPAWYDAISYCISTTNEQQIVINRKAYALRNEKEKIAALVALKKELLTGNKQSTLKEVIQETKINPVKCRSEDFLFCTWKECQEMKESGLVTFGSHSVNHEIMTALSIEEAEKEATISKKTIEKRLNRACTGFAYPFGNYNDCIIESTQKAGYFLGFSTDYGFNTKKTKSYALKRIALNNRYDTPIFMLTLFCNFPALHHWALEKYSWINSWIKKYRKY